MNKDRVTVTINGQTIFDVEVEEIDWRKSGDSLSLRAGPKQKDDPERRAKAQKAVSQLGQQIGDTFRQAIAEQGIAGPPQINGLPKMG